ncbi:MerR family transcriptional regulator [Leuconostoc gasicomitatum]|uniref:MerR family transcriptional regulator n=1 Tax=Leuconostoc gasicomitatum TaxID=115778 RepID=A0A9Q3XUJ6_9LACO|nr:MerR family transcriptional regulator [Leuconostoc gasicomitatum]MBZ5962896.1 MerR family transcriptional regulator [Leuconostoc gasicomitatum]
MKTYKLSEVAEKLGLSLYTLRYYSKKGLFPELKRSSTGMKLFTHKDFEWLFVIDSLKKSGMTINQIKNYVNLMQAGDQTLSERSILLQQQQKNIANKIDQLLVAKQIIDYKSWLYSEYENAGTSDIEIKQTNLVPKNLREIEGQLFNLRDSKLPID